MSEILPFHIDPEQWAQDIAEQCSNPFPPELTISDVDDTVMNSNLAWYNDYLRLAREVGANEGTVVDIETFGSQGPRIILTKHHSLVTPDQYPSYKHRLMHDPTFHESMQPLDDAANALTSFTGMPDGYISTRPTILGDATRRSLTSACFAPTPLLLRSEHIPYGQTVEFKIIALRALRGVLPPGTVVNYVDDYHGVISGITDLQDSGIRGIHYGSHTWQEIVRDHLG